jgi:hypothetical protein
VGFKPASSLEEEKGSKNSDTLKFEHALSENLRSYLQAGLCEGGAAADATRNEEMKRSERAPLDEGSWRTWQTTWHR